MLARTPFLAQTGTIAAFSAGVLLLCFVSHDVHAGHVYKELEQPIEPAAVAGDKVLTPAEVDSEIDLVLYIFERGYAGRAFVPETAWKAAQGRLEKAKGRSMTVATLCDTIADALWQLPDAHASAKRQSVSDRKSVRCGTLAAKELRKSQVGTNRGDARAKETPWTFERVSNGRRSTGVMSIMYFPAHESPEWKGYDQAVKELLSADAAIIDMRGNGGGDDTRGFQLANALADAEVHWNVARVHHRQTPEALTLRINWSYDSDGSIPEFMKERYKEAVTTRDAVLKQPPSSEYRVSEQSQKALVLGPKAYRGRIAILVDSNCASSCESSLEVMRKHPNARVFGERTGGFVHFGNVTRFTLPKSGIRLGIPSKYNEYPDGKICDKIGFEPDVDVPAGTDAFEVAKAWLDSGVGPSLVRRTSRFVFASNIRTNLYNLMLMWAGVELKQDAPWWPRISERETDFQTLAETERARWQQAVRVFAKGVGDRNILFDDGLLAVRDHFAGTLPLDKVPTEDRALVGAVEGVLDIYERRWWPAHQSKNHDWLNALLPTLARVEVVMTTRLAAAYGVQWPSDPLPVDVSVYAGALGAYTSNGRVTISSTRSGYEMPYSVEMVLHEASHLGSLQPALESALTQAFQDAKKQLPNRLWHDLIFYTSGEVARLTLAEVDSKFAGYRHYGEATGVYERSKNLWGPMRPVLDRTWGPFVISGSVDSKRRADALRAFARDFPEGL